MKRSISVILTIAILMAFAFTSIGFTSIAVKSIKLNSTSVKIQVGKTYTLKVIITPTNATNKKLTFSSANKNIATVDKNGKIKGIKPGKTVITVTSASNKKAVTKCNVTISQVAVAEIQVMLPDLTGLDNVEGIKNDRIMNYIQDKLKLKIILQTAFLDEYSQKLQLSLAAGTAADILQFQRANQFGMQVFSKGLSEELFFDMGDTVFKNPERYKALNMLFNDQFWKFLNDMETGDAKKYFSLHSIDYTKRSVGAPMFNMTVLNKLNLSLPTTIDEFVNVLKAIKSGAKDVIPYSYAARKGAGYSNDIDWLFFSAYGTSIRSLIPDENGYFHDYSTSDKSKEALKLINGLYKDGLLDKEVMTRDETNMCDNFSAGKIAVIGYFFPFPPMANWIADYASKINKDITYNDLQMPEHPLKGPAGTQFCYGSSLSTGYDTVISKTSKNPDRALDLLNFIYSDEGQTTIFYGIKDVHYTIGSNGELKLNMDEYKKEAGIYQKEVTNNTPWYPFAHVVCGNNIMAKFEKEGSFTEGIAKGEDLNVKRTKISPQSKYYQKIFDTWNKESYRDYPPYVAFVNMDEAEKNISKKLEEIKTKWFVPFIVGEKNIDKEWQSYVDEMNKAGIADYEKAYNKRVQEARTKYESYSK